MRDSLEKSEDLVARANAESSRRISQFAAVLAESAGLKAAIGLLREAPAPGNAAEVRRTIEAQLRELHALVGYDLLAVTDWKGRTMAAVEFREGEVRTATQLPEITAEPALMETGGVLYELTTTPIAIGGEQIGELRLGSKFDLARYHLAGETALLRGRTSVARDLSRPGVGRRSKNSFGDAARSPLRSAKSIAPARLCWYCQSTRPVLVPAISCWPSGRWIKR